jgi:hypothetical protein
MTSALLYGHVMHLYVIAPTIPPSSVHKTPIWTMPPSPKKEPVLDHHGHHVSSDVTQHAPGLPDISLVTHTRRFPPEHAIKKHSN